MRCAGAGDWGEVGIAVGIGMRIANGIINK
jgi:hypothetical protein